MDMPAGLKLDAMISSGTFPDMLFLAEAFWGFDQPTRLRILRETTVNPFLIRNNFSRFFCAFGFRDYFVRCGGGSLEERAAAVKARFDELISKMRTELLEIVKYKPSPTRESLEISFCDNVETYAFLSPMYYAGMEDYNAVMSAVRELALSMKYSDLRAMAAQYEQNK
jgi:hypothetical protein